MSRARLNMPIKVRCEGCQTVLNVPDQAAGKAVKCKQCGGRVLVPGGESEAATAARPRPKSRPKAASEDPDDVLFGVDLNRAEDTNRRICPGCARPVREEDIDCPKCGVTIATGALSERQRLKIARKGPPPAEFYGVVWGNGWKFLKKHWQFGVQTAMVWTICLSMACTCLFALGFYVKNRTAALEVMVAADTTNIRIEGNSVVITVPEEKGSKVLYDGTYYTTPKSVTKLPIPRLMAQREPPALFWTGMTLVFQLGFGGWAWTLATTIAGVTMAGEKKVKRFTLDFFGNLTMGFRFYVWPVILTLPLFLIAVAIGFFNIQAALIVGGLVMIIPLLVLPAAVVHMAQKYTHRAWLLTWMLRDFGKTIGPSLYVFAMNLFLVLLVPIVVAVAGTILQGRILDWLLTQEVAVLEWLKSNVVDFGEGNLRFLFYQMPLVFTTSFLFFLIVCGLMSFPAVFMMRVIGLYGLYFRADLAVVNEFPDLEPVGFGPRYLAFLVDYIILGLLSGVGQFVGSLFGLLFNFYGWSSADQLAQGIGAVASLALFGFYFASGESGAARATLGKWSLGMIVLRDDNKVQTRQQAFGRAASAFVTILTLYIGFIMCFFRADKKAMHDLMSKSKVVWQSETG
jgi:uncharacterized RDD family membrane protein YckC/ribosomal protein S27E